jgi:hypothetical protein
MWTCQVVISHASDHQARGIFGLSDTATILGEVVTFEKTMYTHDRKVFDEVSHSVIRLLTGERYASHVEEKTKKIANTIARYYLEIADMTSRERGFMKPASQALGGDWEEFYESPPGGQLANAIRKARDFVDKYLLPAWIECPSKTSLRLELFPTTLQVQYSDHLDKSKQFDHGMGLQAKRTTATRDNEKEDRDDSARKRKKPSPSTLRWQAKKDEEIRQRQQAKASKAAKPTES